MQISTRITTYDEIRKSYPKFSVSSWTTDNEQIEREWNEAFRKSLGPLYRSKFRRILIDGKSETFGFFL